MNFKVLIIYFSVISIISVILSVYDKIASKKGAFRISEKALMTAGFLGGALSMYIIMKLIHHKTKHKLFMIGLPVEIVLHFAVIILLLCRNYIVF